jgi:hypothetical protein
VRYDRGRGAGEVDAVKVGVMVVAVVGAAALVGMTVVCTATVDVLPLPFCGALLDTLLDLSHDVRRWLG